MQLEGNSSLWNVCPFVSRTLDSEGACRLAMTVYPKAAKPKAQKSASRHFGLPRCDSALVGRSPQVNAG